ncbi:hypothetical protein PO909_022604 [Leuciscus waleckii]
MNEGLTGLEQYKGEYLRALPLFGASLQKPFREYLEAQRAKLQHRTGRAGGSKGEATPIVSEDDDQCGLFLI